MSYRIENYGVMFLVKQYCVCILRIMVSDASGVQFFSNYPQVLKVNSWYHS